MMSPLYPTGIVSIVGIARLRLQDADLQLCGFAAVLQEYEYSC